MTASSSASPVGPPVTTQHVFRLWLPLASSWLLMAFELPLVTMAVARFADAKVNLAAYGGYVMPMSLLVEAPIIMLLTASTALCRDSTSYRLVRRFMMTTCAALTAVHALIAFTSLHDFILLDVFGAPVELLEPARLGLQIMLPWTWAIGYRRFHQGLLIRAGRPRYVTLGSVLRLLTNGSVLTLGLLHGGLAGLAVGTAGIAAGVTAEAVFAGLAARPVTRDLEATPPPAEALTLRGFLSFYVPLALTTMLSLTLPPIGAAVMSRMSMPLQSLAAWPAAWGFTFVVRSTSYAFNEVVVTLLDEPKALVVLRRFARTLAMGSSAFVILFAATPLSSIWYAYVSSLPPELVKLCIVATLLAGIQPAFSAYEMFFQGRLVHARRTRTITKAMLLHLCTATLLFALGMTTVTLPGIYYVIVVLTASMAVKTTYLAYRVRGSARV